MVESLVRERDDAIVQGLQFEVGDDFISVLDDVMAEMSARKGHAPGADGMHAEMLTVLPMLTRQVILYIWQACGHLGLMPELFVI